MWRFDCELAESIKARCGFVFHGQQCPLVKMWRRLLGLTYQPTERSRACRSRRSARRFRLPKITASAHSWSSCLGRSLVRVGAQIEALRRAVVHGPARPCEAQSRSDLCGAAGVLVVVVA